MKFDPNGQRTKPNRILYALAVGIGYVVDEIVSTFTDFAFVLALVADALNSYKDVKSAKIKTRTEQARRIIENSALLKKKIEKEVRAAARKAAIQVFKKSFSGLYLLGRFGIGIVQGGRNKYFNYANCYRNVYYYAEYVVKTRLH